VWVSSTRLGVDAGGGGASADWLASSFARGTDVWDRTVGGKRVGAGGPSAGVLRKVLTAPGSQGKKGDRGKGGKKNRGEMGGSGVPRIQNGRRRGGFVLCDGGLKGEDTGRKPEKRVVRPRV